MQELVRKSRGYAGQKAQHALKIRCVWEVSRVLRADLLVPYSGICSSVTRFCVT